MMMMPAISMKRSLSSSESAEYILFVRPSFCRFGSSEIFSDPPGVPSVKIILYCIRQLPGLPVIPVHIRVRLFVSALSRLSCIAEGVFPSRDTVTQCCNYTGFFRFPSQYNEVPSLICSVFCALSLSMREERDVCYAFIHLHPYRVLGRRGTTMSPIVERT